MSHKLSKVDFMYKVAMSFVTERGREFEQDPSSDIDMAIQALDYAWEAAEEGSVSEIFGAHGVRIGLQRVVGVAFRALEADEKRAKSAEAPEHVLEGYEKALSALSEHVSRH
jgi:hypothetical protein